MSRRQPATDLEIEKTTTALLAHIEQVDRTRKALVSLLKRSGRLDDLAKLEAALAEGRLQTPESFLQVERQRGEQRGAAIAFGLIGMAEAIRYRTRMFTCEIGDDYEVGYWTGFGDAKQDMFESTTPCPHGNGYIAECLECIEGPYGG